MRNIIDVIDEIKNIIFKNDIEVNSDFYKRMDWIIDDISYKAPEVKYVSWNYLQQELWLRFFPIIDDGHLEIWATFTDTSVEECRKKMKEYEKNQAGK